jgi:hypothetical protein
MNLRRALACAALLLPLAAHASFLAGEALDTAADWLSWFVLVLIPIVAIGGFLFVHVLPEKIAEKRHHPHKDSIKVLCILSLFFGGMLWPLAWLWAYTRPLGFRAIYGTEKHESYYLEQGELALEGKLSPEQIAQLRAELAVMQSKGPLPVELRVLVDAIDRLPASPAASPAAPPVLTARAPLVAQPVTGGTP